VASDPSALSQNRDLLKARLAPGQNPHKNLGLVTVQK
jgi:hypothetical protein